MENYKLNLNNIIIKNIKNTKLDSISDKKTFVDLKNFPTSLEEVKNYIDKHKEETFCYYLINDNNMIADFIFFQTSFGTAESFKYALEYYQNNIESIETCLYHLIEKNLTDGNNTLRGKDIFLILPLNNYLEIIFEEIINVDSIEKTLAFALVNGFDKCNNDFIANSVLTHKNTKVSKLILGIDEVKKYIYENTETILKTYHKNNAMSKLNQQFIIDNIFYLKNEGVANFIKDSLLNLHKIFAKDIAVLTYFDSNFKNYEKSKNLIQDFYSFINFLRQEKIIDYKSLPEYTSLVDDLKNLVPEKLKKYIDYLEFNSELTNLTDIIKNNGVGNVHKKIKI